MIEGQKKVCDICDVNLYGNYCHNCGQKISGKTLNWMDVFKEFIATSFSLEKAGLGTMYAILKSPKKVINSYWNGNRRYYTSPFKLMIYASLIIGLHVTYNENLIFGLAFTTDPKVFFIFLFLFIFILSSYVQYIRRGYSFLQNLVANTYLFSVLAIVFILVFEMLHLWITSSAVIGLSFLVGLICLLSIYSAIVFSHKHGKINLFLNMLAQFGIISFILFVVASLASIFSDLEISFN